MDKSVNTGIRLTQLVFSKRLEQLQLKRSYFLIFADSRNQLKKYEEGYLTNDQIKSISQDLGVTENEVKQMEGRVFNQDFSLNTPLNDENDSEWIDQVEDDNIDLVTRIEKRDELDKRKALYNQAVKKLELVN